MQPATAAIRPLREERGLTGKQLAHLAGVSQSHLSRIERGLVVPSRRVLKDIGQALGRDLAERSDAA